VYEVLLPGYELLIFLITIEFISGRIAIFGKYLTPQSLSKFFHFLIAGLLCFQAVQARQVISKKGRGPLFLVAPSTATSTTRQFVFTHYNTFNGLAANLVSNLVQDRKGYIWLATPNGLQRYDGNKFITFRHQHGNPATLPEDNVGRVYIDRQNRLWVLTADNRIGTFDTDNFIYREVKMEWSGEIPTLFIGKMLVETREGKLLLFTGSYDVYLYHPETNNFTIAKEVVLKPATWKRRAAFYDTLTRKFWTGCDSGLVMYDPVTQHLNYRGHNPDKDKAIDVLSDLGNVLNINIDGYGRFLLGTWEQKDGGPRLHYFNVRTGVHKKHIISNELFAGGGYHEIAGVMEQRNGRMWVHGLPFIAQYVEGERPLQAIRNEYKDEQSIKFDVAYFMYEDRAGNMWVSTSNGIYLFNPDAQLFDAYHLLRPDGSGVVDGPTKSVLEVDSNTIWIGTWGVGIYAYDKKFNPVSLPPGLKPFEEIMAVWCMQRHPATRKIWMGLQDGGMIIYDPASEKAEHLRLDVFKGHTIRQMIVDKQGNLWFGTQGGLIIKWTYKPGRPLEEGFTLLTRETRILKLFLDKEGYLWVGTQGHGLLKIDPVSNKIIEQYRAKGPQGKRLWNDSPADIVQTDDSTLVIACSAVCILNTKTGNVRYISTDEGLPTNNVMCLAKDRQGIIWMGMISGICRMNMQKMIFTSYDGRDGMSSDMFEIDDAHHLSDGRLLFTNNHDFVVFDPDKMIRAEKPQDAVITDVKVDNVSLSLDSMAKLSVISLQHDKSSVVFEFGGFNFVRQHKIDYYYQLVGVDKGWVKADDRKQALYNHLSPGNYVFKVKSENADGVTSEGITTLKIYVMPPFWRTWWFYGSLLLLVIGVLYWIDRERMKRLREMQAMRTQIAGNLHEDINTTLNNINMLSEMAKIKADKDLNRSKEYIDQISEKSHNMIIAMDDMLWSIDPQNDSMEKTLLRMLEYVDALVNRHGANIDILVDEQVRSLELDMKSRHEMLLIFKEVLRNMVQASTGSHILVNIDQVKSKLCLKMQDDGVYSTEADIFTPGALNMLEKRTQSLSAEIDIHTDKNGASVILQVPVAKKNM
jgi:ligand-binding sensor domain-containing protein